MMFSAVSIATPPRTPIAEAKTSTERVEVWKMGILKRWMSAMKEMLNTQNMKDKSKEGTPLIAEATTIVGKQTDTTSSKNKFTVYKFKRGNDRVKPFIDSRTTGSSAGTLINNFFAFAKTKAGLGGDVPIQGSIEIAKSLLEDFCEGEDVLTDQLDEMQTYIEPTDTLSECVAKLFADTPMLDTDDEMKFCKEIMLSKKERSDPHRCLAAMRKYSKRVMSHGYVDELIRKGNKFLTVPREVESGNSFVSKHALTEILPVQMALSNPGDRLGDMTPTKWIKEKITHLSAACKFTVKTEEMNDGPTTTKRKKTLRVEETSGSPKVQRTETRTPRYDMKDTEPPTGSDRSDKEYTSDRYNGRDEPERDRKPINSTRYEQSGSSYNSQANNRYTDGRGTSNKASDSGSQDKVCLYHNTQRGCVKGNSCTWKHIGPTRSNSRPQPTTYGKVACRNWSNTGTCAYGDRCSVTHNGAGTDGNRHSVRRATGNNFDTHQRDREPATSTHTIDSKTVEDLIKRIGDDIDDRCRTRSSREQKSHTDNDRRPVNRNVHPERTSLVPPATHLLTGEGKAVAHQGPRGQVGDER